MALDGDDVTRLFAPPALAVVDHNTLAVNQPAIETFQHRKAVVQQLLEKVRFARVRVRTVSCASAV
jgi:hypothetical protein